jgi:hypothetical protein
MPVRTSLRAVLALSILGGAAACDNAGSDLGFNVSPTSAVTVGVYLDRDGSRTPTVPLDTLFPNARVALLAFGSGDTLRTTLSTQAGLARFEGVPVGQYRVTVVPSSIGDSIQVAAIDSAVIRLVAADTNTFVLVRLGYPEVSIRQARLSPPGRRVFIRGVILAGVQSFRDTTSHVADSSSQIRLTRVVLLGGLLGNNPGDSVSVLGHTSTRDGQPTLDNAGVARFAVRPPPIPLAVSTAVAATASGGLLDAGLVQITGGIISDTATIAPDFRITVNDGSGALQIIIDGNLQIPRSIFRPGASMIVRGVLVPTGFGGWTLKPRAGGDIVIN